MADLRSSSSLSPLHSHSRVPYSQRHPPKRHNCTEHANPSTIAQFKDQIIRLKKDKTNLTLENSKLRRELGGRTSGRVNTEAYEFGSDSEEIDSPSQEYETPKAARKKPRRGNRSMPRQRQTEVREPRPRQTEARERTPDRSPKPRRTGPAQLDPLPETSYRTHTPSHGDPQTTDGSYITAPQFRSPFLQIAVKAQALSSPPKTQKPIQEEPSFKTEQPPIKAVKHDVASENDQLKKLINAQKLELTDLKLKLSRTIEDSRKREEELMSGTSISAQSSNEPDVDGLKKRLSDLQRRIRAAESQRIEDEEILQKATLKIKNLENELRLREKMMVTLEQEVKQYRETQSESYRMATTKNAEALSLKRSNELLKKEITELRTELILLKSDSDAIGAAQQMRDREVRQKTTELISFAKENEQLRAKVGELEQELFRLQHTLPKALIQ